MLPGPAAVAAAPVGNDPDDPDHTVVVDTVTYYLDGVVVEGEAVETYDVDGAATASSVAPYETVDGQGELTRRPVGRTSLRLASNRTVTWRDLRRWMEHPEQLAPVGTGRLLTKAEVRARLAAARTSLRGPRGGSSARAAAAAAPAGPAAFDVAASACLDGDYSDNDVHIRACVRQKKAGSYLSGGKRHFLVSRQGIATGWSTDSGCRDCDRIEGVGTYGWSTNADRPENLDWAPAGAVVVRDNCVTKTTSSTYDIRGVSATSSQSNEICPDKLDVWTDGHGITYYMGSKWSGKDVDKNETRGTIWTSVGVWTPGNQSGDTLNLWVHGHMWWD
ncbi:hypothetical protein GCM10009795_026460 [Nocardioides hankookensis]